MRRVTPPKHMLGDKAYDSAELCEDLNSRPFRTCNRKQIGGQLQMIASERSAYGCNRRNDALAVARLSIAHMQLRSSWARFYEFEEAGAFSVMRVRLH